MRDKNVMVLGSGGREHALAWALSRSPQVKQVYVVPGNGGTEWHGNESQVAATNVDIDLNDFSTLVSFAHQNKIDLTVVGPENALADGVVDCFEAEGLAIFGPSKAAAQLEASKAFAKDIMQANAISTADFGVFDLLEDAQKFIREFDRPMVVKADGLAAGKGVFVCRNLADAENALIDIMQTQAFGAENTKVVIEEQLFGREVSVLAFCDGKNAVPLLMARDHKRALDGDQGLNTGGMGAFAPVTDISEDQLATIVTTILQPALDGMAAQGTPYIGILYAGLMLTAKGMYVLEFNCRFGDPETQVVLPLLKTDLVEIFEACISETLDQIEIEWHDQICATVIVAAPGYPQSYPKGLPIRVDDLFHQQDDLLLFHAGTTHADSKLVTSGGRVLNVTAIGDDLESALNKAYLGVDMIQFEGMHFRRDIGRTGQVAAND